jgi:hypothetical protein
LIPGPGYQILDTRSWIPDPGCQILAGAIWVSKSFAPPLLITIMVLKHHCLLYRTHPGR